MRKNFIWLLLVCLWVAAASAKTVDLTLAPRVVGNTIYIEGTTDLPDGAIIEWELRHEHVWERRDIPIEHMSGEGHTVVRGHRYYAAVNLSNWPSGSIEVWVAFQPRSYGTRQPAYINGIFGINGEGMDGANVTYHPAQMRRVELIKNVSLRTERAGR
jgi:hypothetical protein